MSRADMVDSLEATDDTLIRAPSSYLFSAAFEPGGRRPAAP
jgi:hypothetical protein